MNFSLESNITGSQSSLMSNTSSSGSGGGSSWCQNFLSRTFTSTSHQDLAAGSQVGSRARSLSISPDFLQSDSASQHLPFSFARRGSFQPPSLPTNTGGFFTSSPLVNSRGNVGSSGGGDERCKQENNDHVEKECKQVFFDCAL